MAGKTAFSNFQFDDSGGFLWNRNHYAFDQVVHLKLSWIRTTERVLSAKAGDYDQAYVHITLKEGKKIRFGITEKPSFLGLSIAGIKRQRKSEIDDLQKIYSYLLDQTFTHRLQPFLTAIENEGYFKWDRCQFHPKERTIRSGKRTFPVDECEFFREYKLIQVKRKKPSLPWDTAVFRVDTDQDVIFYLLDRFFQLRWPNKG